MKTLPTIAIAAFLALTPTTETKAKTAKVQPQGVTSGVSHNLAVARAKAVSDIAYDLTFDIPAKKSERVRGNATITFDYNGRKSDTLQIDFQGQTGQFDGHCTVNGRQYTAAWRDEHVLIPAHWLRRGKNTVTMSFTSGDKSLNRNDDYMYTLFVPDHARSVFPCFDQPDMKALFSVHLNVPEGWQSMASVSTERIPTYLFSFVAGRFSKQTAVCSGRTITALYRETDPNLNNSYLFNQQYCFVGKHIHTPQLF